MIERLRLLLAPLYREDNTEIIIINVSFIGMEFVKIGQAV